MLPLPSSSELRRRGPRLIGGLVVMGLGVALMVRGDLGLAPWDVLHQGLSRRTGIQIGTVGILMGLPVLALWVPLRQRIGLATVLNILLIGLTVDAVLAVVPEVDQLGARVALMAAGIVLMGLGCGGYIGAGLGPGPRDGLMTALADRGWGSVRAVRTGLELSVLVLGWVLGGSVGIGTVLLAVTIGPIVQWTLDVLGLPSLVPTEPVPSDPHPSI